MNRFRWFLVGSLVLGLTACVFADDDAFDVVSPSDKDHYVIGALTLPDMLAGDHDLDPGVIVVEGAITNVDDGVGLIWSTSASGRTSVVQCGDEKADSHTAHLDLRVEHVISPGSRGASFEGSEVRFGLRLDDEGDVSVLRSGFVDQRVVVFLTQSGWYSYEPDILDVGVDGALLCRRAETVPLECPALDSRLATDLQINAVTESMLEPAD